MLQIKVLGTTPPCANCKRAEAQARQAAEQFPGQVEIVTHTGPGDPQWAEYAIDIVPALVIGDKVRFIGVVPSRESLTGALRLAGLT